MSVVHELLSQLEEKEKETSDPWLAEDGQKQKGLFVFDLPNEIVNDFYDLKEYIRIANMRGQMRVLSITSSLPGEGSSTIATYLAHLMGSRMGKSLDSANSKPESQSKNSKGSEIFKDTFSSDSGKSKTSGTGRPKTGEFADSVLIIDANLHEPSLHNKFGLRRDGGLAEIIEHQLDWRKYVKTVQHTGLKIMTAGRSEVVPAELVGSDIFRVLIKELRENFRYIILDSPPVLKYVDALSLSTVADGVILVVCSGKTRWEVAQSAKRKLAVAQANLLGVALNRSKMNVYGPVASMK
ncbi:CpsD/CapB family tyrosine-protein kinase [candidate division KSB1 bacterium]|nr:CpsD/CapB family tyrosine-protein kinase [candidate division KSB1 bacterium]